jgi:hypothetical protein
MKAHLSPAFEVWGLGFCSGCRVQVSVIGVEMKVVVSGRGCRG